MGGIFGGGTAAGKAMGAINYTPEAIAEQNFSPEIQKSQGAVWGDIGQQQQFAQALQAQMYGAGPNPALEQQKAAMQQAAQQGAGMVASQKGINPALAARMASQSTAQAQQQAASQAAQLRAQQILGTQQQLGQQYNTMTGEQLGYQGMLQQAQAAQNQAINQRSGIEAGVQQANAANALQATQGMMQMGGSALSMLALSDGGHVPGKAKKSGDSYDNDTVPAMLSPGEIVVPRSKASDPDKAKEFIDHLMAQKGKSSSAGPDDDKLAKILAENKQLKTKLAKLRGK